MVDEVEKERQRFEFLKSEYSLVESKWRFLQGLRYAVFAGIAAALTSLYALYANALIFFQGKPPHGVGRWSLVLIPVVALTILEAGRLLEARLRNLYGHCSARGAEIEEAIGNPNGIFSLLLRLDRPSPLDHTVAIGIASVIISGVWALMLIFGYFVTEGRVQ